MVTAAKGAENFYNYTNEEVSEKKSSESEGEIEGLKVRKESPELVTL